MNGFNDGYPMSEDTKEMLNALGWIISMLLVAAGWTFPLWGALLGLY